MRVFCPHPRDDYNIGDLMTFYGTKYLMREAFGNNVEFLQFDIRRSEAEFKTYVPEYNWGNDVDAIVLAGSPWLGTNPASHKMKLLKQAIRRWPKAKRIALGLGSFFRVRDMAMGTFGQHGEEGKGYDAAKQFKKFDLIITRDEMAHTLLNRVGIENTLFYDTSIFSRFGFRARHTFRKSNVLIFQDPLKADCADHIPEYLWQYFINYQLQWANDNDAEIVVISSADKSTLQKLGVKAAFVTDLEWMAWYLSGVDKVLTPRVHQAILAKIMGANWVGCVPSDSRCLTAINLGIEIVQPDIKGKVTDFGNPSISGFMNAESRHVFDLSPFEAMPFSAKALLKGKYTKALALLLREVTT